MQYRHALHFKRASESPSFMDSKSSSFSIRHESSSSVNEFFSVQLQKRRRPRGQAISAQAAKGRKYVSVWKATDQAKRVNHCPSLFKSDVEVVHDLALAFAPGSGIACSGQSACPAGQPLIAWLSGMVRR